jgi:hypothetical protein
MLARTKFLAAWQAPVRGHSKEKPGRSRAQFVDYIGGSVSSNDRAAGLLFAPDRILQNRFYGNDRSFDVVNAQQSCTIHPDINPADRICIRRCSSVVAANAVSAT